MPFPMVAAAALMGGSLLAKALNKTPDFKPVGFERLDPNDPRYRYEAETEFGQGTARDNMDRYGFQGVYQNYLKGETERMKSDEMQRIQRLASGLAPGQASLRSGVASQGVNGSMSNVIARQQREQGLTKALDFAGETFEASSARLDNSYFNATAQNEGMRFGASQDYMKAVGMGSNARNEATRFNADTQRQINQYNSQGQFNADSFNANGEFMQEKGEFDKWNSIFDDMGSIGATVMGAGLPGMMDGGGVPQFGGGDYDFLKSGGWTSDGNGGYDWSAPSGGGAGKVDYSSNMPKSGFNVNRMEPMGFRFGANSPYQGPGATYRRY